MPEEGATPSDADASTNLETAKSVESTLMKLARSVADTSSTGGGPAKKRGGQSGIAWGLIAAGIVAIIIAVMGFAAVWARRKAARLQHEINVRDERILQEKERAGMAVHEKERAEIEIDIAKIESEIKALGAKKEAAAAKAESFRKEVEAITSWDDVEVVDGRL